MPKKILLSVVVLAGCSAAPIQPPLRSVAIASFKADATVTMGQPVRISGKVGLPTACFQEPSVSAQVDDLARTIHLTATARDTSADRVCEQMGVFRDFEVQVVPASTGSYLVQADFVPPAAVTVAAPSAPPANGVDEVVRQWRASIPFRTVFLQSSFFKQEEPQALVFRSDADVAAFAHAHGDSPIATEKLSLDFSKETGILQMFGIQATPLRCEIFAIGEADGGLTAHGVKWVGAFPSDGLAAIATPAHYVAIARTEREVRFADTIDVPYAQQPPDIPWPAVTR